MQFFWDEHIREHKSNLKKFFVTRFYSNNSCKLKVIFN